LVEYRQDPHAVASYLTRSSRSRTPWWMVPVCWSACFFRWWGH